MTQITSLIFHHVGIVNLRDESCLVVCCWHQVPSVLSRRAEVVNVNEKLHIDCKGIKCIYAEHYKPYPDNIFSLIIQYSSFLTRPLVYVINIWLVPDTACEISPALPRIVDGCIF